MSARYIVGDVFDGLRSLDAGSVDLVVSSPPFLALRSYLPADHPDKAKEIGSEATPGAFLDVMLDVVEECARVLAPHGSLVFELGDTYAGSGGAGGDYSEGGMREGAPGFAGSAKHQRIHDPSIGPPIQNKDYKHRGVISGNGWPLDKSKVLVPQLFAIALSYGFNPLTGRTTEPWRVRNTVAWCRPNPPVGRDGDKFRPATSFLTVACKARDRYWDGDAVRVPWKPRDDIGEPRAYHADPSGDGYDRSERALRDTNGGAPLLDWWNIPTAPYKGSHYATYPPDLVVPLVRSMCPQRVCRVCGEPSRRITETRYAARDGSGYIDGRSWADADEGRSKAATRERNGNSAQPPGGDIANAERETLGWSDCGHDDWRPGLVCDPFAGSGTTLAVASGHGLDSIGVDLDERNADLARERVGMFLQVEYLHRAAEAV